MTQFTTVVQATSNTSTNTEDLFLELKASAAGTTFKVKRVRVGYGDGTQTAAPANFFRVRLLRYTTTTAGTTGTPLIDRVARDPQLPAAATTSKGKSGTTACAIGTGSVTAVDTVNPYGLALWEFLARDDYDYICAVTGGCFCVAIQSSVVSQIFTVTVDHAE